MLFEIIRLLSTVPWVELFLVGEILRLWRRGGFFFQVKGTVGVISAGPIATRRLHLPI